jgi:hypothetical protein
LGLISYNPDLILRVLRDIRAQPRSALVKPGILLYLWAHLLFLGLLAAGILSGLSAEL